jgi:hypothetical protein
MLLGVSPIAAIRATGRRAAIAAWCNEAALGVGTVEENIPPPLEGGGV